MSRQDDEVTRVNEGCMGLRKLGKEKMKRTRISEKRLEKESVGSKQKDFPLTKHARMGGRGNDGLILGNILEKARQPEKKEPQII